jgi:hypothetical protein
VSHCHHKCTARPVLWHGLSASRASGMFLATRYATRLIYGADATLQAADVWLVPYDRE